MSDQIEIKLDGELSPQVKKYIDDKMSALYEVVSQIKTSECIMTTGEQHEVIYYLRCMISGTKVNLDKIPAWLVQLETARKNYIAAQKLLWEWVTFTRITSALACS